MILWVVGGLTGIGARNSSGWDSSNRAGEKNEQIWVPGEKNEKVFFWWWCWFSFGFGFFGVVFILFFSFLFWFGLGFFGELWGHSQQNWRPTLQLSIYWTPIYTLQQMQVECFGINLPGSYTEWGGNFFSIWMSVWIPHSQWWESLQLMIDNRSAFLLYYVALETTSRRHFQISKRCWPWQISAKGVIRNDPSAWW